MKIGYHVNRITRQVTNSIKQLRPTVVKTLDCNYDWLSEIKPYCGLIIYREYTPVQDLGKSVKEARQFGHDFARKLLSRQAVKDGLVDLVEGYNEVHIEDGDSSRHNLYDNFQDAFRSGLGGVVEPIAFNFGNGHMMGNIATSNYPLTCSGYTWFGFHEYDWPTMDRLHQQGLSEGNGGMWLALRYRRIMPDIIRKYGNNKKAIITEFGITQAAQPPRPDVGWKADPSLSEQEYIETIKWYGREIEKDGYVKGACLFATGATGDWETFESLDLMSKFIVNGNGQQPEPDPQPPINGGNEVTNDIVVVDNRPANDPSLSIVKRMSNWNDAVREMKVGVSKTYGYDACNDGEKYWRLAKVEVSVGPANYTVKLLSESGSPVPSILVFNNWPDASQMTGGSPNPPYFPNSDAGFTNSNGTIGFSFGGGNVVGPNGGPNNIWVSSDPPSAPNARRWSDCLTNLGWAGGTDHLTLHPTFVLTTKVPEVIAPPPGGDGNGSTGDVINRGDYIIVTGMTYTLPDGAKVHPVYWNPDAVVADDFTPIEGVTYKYGGKEYFAVGVISEGK